MVAFLVLSTTLPLVALLRFLCVREKKEKKVFCKNCFGLKVPLYCEGTDDLINFYLFVYLNENPKGTTVTSMIVRFIVRLIIFIGS